jgi:hypothetical protein
MSPSRDRRCAQRLATGVVPVLTLLLGLSLQPLSSTAEPTGPSAASANRPNPVTPAPREIARGSTPATTAQTAAPRKQTRPAKRNSGNDARMRQAVEQVAVQRDTEKRAQRLRDLLAAAQLDYIEGRVFDPPGNNAADRYKQVLELDPTQEQALSATQRIADIVAAEAENVALAGDAPKTLQYILQIRSLQPKHPSLQGLEARYQALLANPVVFSARQRDRYNRSAQNIDEAYYKLKNQPLELETLEQVIRRYDRAEGLVAQAPGLPKLKDRIILAFPAATRNELAGKDPREALRLVQIARRRGWFTDELGPLEQQAKADIRALPPFPSISKKP